MCYFPSAEPCCSSHRSQTPCFVKEGENRLKNLIVIFDVLANLYIMFPPEAASPSSPSYRNNKAHAAEIPKEPTNAKAGARSGAAADLSLALFPVLFPVLLEEKTRLSSAFVNGECELT